jgi:hypothetical protein
VGREPEQFKPGPSDSRKVSPRIFTPIMTDRSQHEPRWAPLVSGTLITIGFTVLLVWLARTYGRTIGFAFGVNWILIAWAMSLGRALESRSGAWDGLSVQLPASYYATRPIERDGRVYDYFGVRWYQRLLRPMLWSVNPALLRSQREARQTMIRATHHPEAGHLIIFVVIIGITLWALVSGWWDTAAWLLLFNVLHNLYPVLSVRQIRARLQRGGTPRVKKRTQLHGATS